MKTIFIIDNHPLTRKGLASLLEAEAGLAVCGQAACEDEALERLETLEPDLVVLDLIEPGLRGLGLIERLHVRWPTLLILVFTDRPAYALRSLQAGAYGYVSKQGEEAEVVNAIRHVLGGKVYVSEAVCERLLLELAAGPTRVPSDVLSKRELEVFELIGQGLDAEAIAATLDVSPKTVDSYRRRIRSKLKLEGGTELIQRAVQWIGEQERC